MSFFECKDVKFSYGKKEVLRGVSFQAEEGELVGVLGANGSGKTTLLKTICRIYRAEGEIKLLGESIKDKRDREIARLVSYIPQRSGIDVSISALDVVLMGFNAEMGILSSYTKKRRAMAEAALSEVGASHFAHRDYQSLSEGEKQLCIIARSFVSGSKLYLLDEPESSLDFANRNKVMDIISRKVKESGKAALVCLHEPSVALQYCDRLVLIGQGKCIAQLKPKTDDISKMEEALCQIYGEISLVDVDGRLVILPR